MIQPMSVAKWTTSPSCRSAWYAVSRAIDTRKPPCTCTTPFGLPVVPDVYVSRYGVSESTSSAGSSPGYASSSNGASTICTSTPVSRTTSSIAISLPRRDDVSCVITTFASLASQPLLDGRRGEAGEHGHLDRSEMRDRVRCDCDLRRHRQVDRDAVADADAERRELLGESSDVARELGERERAPRAVLAEPDARERVRLARSPAVRAVVRDVELPADEPGRPLGAARVVHDALPRLRELEPHVVDRERPEPLRAPPASGAPARA